MKQDAGVKAFKNELANYRYYKKKLTELQDQLDNCYQSLPGALRTNNPSREPMQGGAPNKDYEYKVREQIEYLSAKISRITNKLYDVEQILNKLEKPMYNAIMAKYVKGQTLEQVAREMYISPAGLLKQINRAIKKALDNN